MRILPCLLGLAPMLAWTAPASAADLALRRVMLSSAGVGYFEYEAEVDGPATLGLDVRLDQVDDVLKSLVVFDDAGGVGGLELPGRDDADAMLGDVPFGPDALETPLALLNSLRGVVVDVQGPRPMSGRIVQAERVREPAGQGRDGTDQGVERTRVTLLSPDGLRQFVLEDVEGVQVSDPALRTGIGRALEALRRQADHDRRHLSISTSGTGHRTVRVGFVAVAPLWKASYRVVLPAGDAAKARFQGWAVLENTTGTDWHGVGLSLQYGNPVTFHQAIYRSYFVQRPEVPVEVLGRLLPDVDTRAVEAKAAEEPAPPPPPAPMVAPMGAAAPQRSMRPRPMSEPARPAETAETAEGADETLFTLAGPLDLPAGHTASVPVIDRDVPATRVGLVSQDRPHPLSAIRVTNDGTESLPAGVLTLYDAAGGAPFAGDARLGGLPPGERRLLSFAEDLRTAVNWRQSDATTLAALTAADGVLRIDERDRRTSDITLAAPAASPRHLLVEVAKQPGATLARDLPAGIAIEETATAWRLAVDVAAGETTRLAVHTDRLRHQETSLLADNATVVRLLGTQGLSDPARAALRRLVDLRTQEAVQTTARTRLEAELAAVGKDEDRLRANLAAVPAGDALHARLVRQLDADETRIATLTQSIADANQAIARARQAFADAVATFRI